MGGKIHTGKITISCLGMPLPSASLCASAVTANKAIDEAVSKPKDNPEKNFRKAPQSNRIHKPNPKSTPTGYIYPEFKSIGEVGALSDITFHGLFTNFVTGPRIFIITVLYALSSSSSSGALAFW